MVQLIPGTCSPQNNSCPVPIPRSSGIQVTVRVSPIHIVFQRSEYDRISHRPVGYQGSVDIHIIPGVIEFYHGSGRKFQGCSFPDNHTCIDDKRETVVSIKSNIGSQSSEDPKSVVGRSRAAVSRQGYIGRIFFQIAVYRPVYVIRKGVVIEIQGFGCIQPMNVHTIGLIAGKRTIVDIR